MHHTRFHSTIWHWWTNIVWVSWKQALIPCWVSSGFRGCTASRLHKSHVAICLLWRGELAARLCKALDIMKQVPDTIGLLQATLRKKTIWGRKQFILQQITQWKWYYIPKLKKQLVKCVTHASPQNQARSNGYGVSRALHENPENQITIMSISVT